MLENCAKLFMAWNDNNVRYCHWKSNEHLEEGLDGITDLDVYVNPIDRILAEQLLTECNYIQFRSQKGARYNDVFEWLGFDHNEGRLIHVHLHYKIITGTKFCKEYIFPVDEDIIDSRILDSQTGVYVTNPNLELLLLYSRIVLKAKDKKNIMPNNDYVKEIVFLKKKIEEPVLREYCRKYLSSTGDLLFSLISKDKLTQEEWYHVYTIVNEWLKPYKNQTPLQVFVKHNLFKIRKKIVMIMNAKYEKTFIDKKTLMNKGISICFIGQDGSGKSTVTIDIQKWLNWKIAAKRFYLGSGDHYTSIFKKLLQRKSTNKPTKSLAVDSNTNKPAAKNNDKTMRHFLRALINATNIKKVSTKSCNNVMKSVDYCSKGAISLYDRFPQLQFEGIYDGPKIKKSCIDKGWNNWYIRHMYNIELNNIRKIQNHQPTIVFKLVLPPEESIRRKPFEDLDAVREKSIITKKLQFPESHVYEIDATQDYKNELLEIKRIIWNHMLQLQ